MSHWDSMASDVSLQLNNQARPLAPLRRKSQEARLEAFNFAMNLRPRTKGLEKWSWTEKETEKVAEMNEDLSKEGSTGLLVVKEKETDHSRTNSLPGKVSGKN